MKIRGIEVTSATQQITKLYVYCPHCGHCLSKEKLAALRNSLDYHLKFCYANPENEGCKSCSNYTESLKRLHKGKRCRFQGAISPKIDVYQLHCPCYNMSIDDFVKRVNDWAKTQDGITEQKGYSGAEAGALTEYDELDGAAGQAMGTSE